MRDSRTALVHRGSRATASRQSSVIATHFEVSGDDDNDDDDDEVSDDGPVVTDIIDVMRFRALGPCGETVLDPTTAELLFVAKWRQMHERFGFEKVNYHIQFEISNWPYVAALGSLPAAFGGPLSKGGAHHSGQAARCDDLLRRVVEATRDVELLPESVQDAGFCSLLRLRIGRAIDALLYGDDGVWEDYTRPAIVRSAPLGLGLAVANSERRRRSANESIAASRKAALIELPGSLEALAHHLGDHETFGSVAESLADNSAGSSLHISALDACAYAHLSVLFSIACEPGSRLQQLLASHKTLVHLCDRLELAVSAWPDARSFLAAIELQDRLQATVAASDSKTNAVASTWNGGKLQRRVPFWHTMAFTLAAAASIATAAMLGYLPRRLEQLLSRGSRALAGASTGMQAE